jgi:DNA-directed RNA polymerase subunit K/omega
MDETNQPLEPAGPEELGAVESSAHGAALIPAEPVPPITSRFLFVDVAALRAKQLRRGAKVRYAESDSVPAARKPERVAMEEVRRGLVDYDVPPSNGKDEGEA